jgi:large subunit ribosomal protein L29
MMTVKEIREKSPEQLRSDLNERQKHLFDLRSQAVTEKLEDPSLLRKTRKDIARILTVMRQREIEAGAPAGSEQQAASTEAASAGAAEAPARERVRSRGRTRTPKRARATKRPTATKRTPRAKQKKTGAKPAARKPAARRTTKKTKAKKTTAKA